MMKNIVSYQDLDLIDLLYLYFLFALGIRRVFSTNQESILLSKTRIIRTYQSLTFTKKVRLSYVSSRKISEGTFN